MSSEYVIVIGVLTSIFMMELVGLSPGGLIVPGYIALYIDSPYRIGATLADAAMALFVGRAVSRHAIVFGRRRFAMFLILGFLARYALERAAPALLPAFLGAAAVEAPHLAAVGWLVPGIIAADADRQGVLKTLAALVVATLLVKLLWMGLA